MHSWKQTSWVFLLLLYSLGWATATVAEPKSIKIGLQAYTAGEFDKAILEMQKSLTQKPTKAERMKIFKYLGLCSYILGRKLEAENHFEQCLSIDSSCRIERKETIVPAVIPFFKIIKKRFAASKNALKPQTRVLVKSPIDEAEILLDGVVVGPVNISHDSEPGVHELTVRAKGYRFRRETISVNKMVENIYDIDLDKMPGKAAKREREKARQNRMDETEDLLEEEVTEDLRVPAPTLPPAPTPPAELTKEPVSIAHFLPFGVGQFYNGDYLLGTLLLSAQAFAVQAVIVNAQDIATAKANAIAANNAAIADSSIVEADVDAYLASQQVLVTKKQKEVNLTIGVAAGTYVFGILHALSTRPYMIKPTQQDLSWHLTPTLDAGLKLSMNWEF